MEQSDEAFYTLINGLRANLDQGWAGDTLTEEDVVVLLAGITRLRAALADAQSVGFAAGVEAAAKVAAMQAVYTREAIKRATASELVSNLVTVTKSITAHDIEIAIRALTPPDAIAAAARVLLGVWPTDDSFRAAFDACAARYHGGDQMQDEMDRTRATVSAALRAIAGDTP